MPSTSTVMCVRVALESVATPSATGTRPRRTEKGTPKSNLDIVFEVRPGLGIEARAVMRRASDVETL